MANGVLVYREDSKYDDFPAARYQFPKMYLKKMEAFVGNHVLYYAPRERDRVPVYFAFAKVSDLKEDVRKEGMYIALIESGSYIPFDVPVPFKQDGIYKESGLTNEDGTLNKGRARWSVREINSDDFDQILREGFPSNWETENAQTFELTKKAGFYEEKQSEFQLDVQRKRSEKTSNSIVRSHSFRNIVLAAYGNCCAITGTQYETPSGQIEVEAAHIRPVLEGGPDFIENALALSRTAHWLFDRGMLSIDKDFKLIFATNFSHVSQFAEQLAPSRLTFLPENSNNWPSQRYLDWHRNKVFLG
ncbi:HNH endonuclease [Maritalea porphyrae]|uniref:Restriction endonuclease n=1 Tax=Maritalea porphyrae TaxID=880732 RepID=A0ABQ5UP95_9HYPH|nr:HNH endonuclease [Maritalea porphyrae]GLQ15772.1 restriction endonuclease [Maritalea porphyrae]